jgi:Hypothetical protein (DUF2513)
MAVRRDIDLVREILLRLESLDAGSGAPIPLDVGEGPIEISGYTKKQIAYHLRIMADGGLIEVQHPGFQGPGDTRIPRFGGLRWVGHEFLDDVRDPETWRATKQKIAKLGGVSLQFAWEIAKLYLRNRLPQL